MQLNKAEATKTEVSAFKLLQAYAGHIKYYRLHGVKMWIHRKLSNKSIPKE